MHVSHTKPFVPDHSLSMRTAKAPAETFDGDAVQRISAQLGGQGNRGNRPSRGHRDDRETPLAGAGADAARSFSSQLSAIDLSKQAGDGLPDRAASGLPTAPGPDLREPSLDELLGKIEAKAA